jgi:hypothetical protein
MVHLSHTKFMTWKRWVVESLTKRFVILNKNHIVSNAFAGGMDPVKGTFLWNYTVRGCEEDKFEELHKSQLGVFGNTRVTWFAAQWWPKIPARGPGSGWIMP